MYQKKKDEDIRCPLEYGLSLFGGKWNSRVLCVLAACGPLRYSEIRDEMVNITDAVLATTLKGLLKNGLIDRHDYEEIPPRVEYTLTPRGQSAIPILQSICRWSDAWQQNGSEVPMRQCQKCRFYH